MKQVTIMLYKFEELGKDEKLKAIWETMISLNETVVEPEEPYWDINNSDDVVDTVGYIDANDYWFFKDGTQANVTRYTGKHKKAGEEELELHGEFYTL